MNINMAGFGHRLPGQIDPVGPTITSVIDLREQPDLDQDMVIEEGGIAGAMATFVLKALSVAAKIVSRDTDSGPADMIREKTRELDSLIRGPYHGAIKTRWLWRLG